MILQDLTTGEQYSNLFNRMGPWEWVIIIGLVVLLFGAPKLPQLGRSLGEGIRSFRKGTSGETDEEEETKPKKKSVRKKSTSKKTTGKKTTA